MAVADENDPKMLYLPLDESHSASGLCLVIRDAWWLVHPERGLCLWDVSASSKRPAKLRGAKPLCNADENVTRRLSKLWPFANVEKRDLVIMPTSNR